jgi:uncharacterized protein YdeI (YjbR/CyaY-like superfamily)
MAGSPDVDIYLQRSDKWPDELAALRTVMLGCGLDEAIKWRQPCWGHEGANIAIAQEMKDFLALMFFKGELMADPEGVLLDVGPNSRSARRIHFTSVADVERLAPTIEAYVAEAIAVEEAGLEVEPAPEPELVAELQERLDADPALRAAFEALTPGRRREYNLHVGDAKKAETRTARVEKCAPQILEGKGLRDR